MVSIELDEVPEIISFMYQDKKNHSGKILCSLLKGIGSAVYDIEINEAEIGEALLHLNLLANNPN
jgi:3-dehydroquinate synthetase